MPYLILSLFISLLLFCFFLLYRNNWVYKVRSELIWNDFEKFERLQSYSYMLYHKFWIFDVEKFLIEK